MQTNNNINQLKQTNAVVLSIKDKQMILRSILYSGIIIVISLLTILCLRLDCYFFGPVINEASITECTQQILLAISTIAFFRVAIENPQLKHAALLISGFFLVLSIRELDFLFDYIKHGFWVYPALLVTAIAIYYAAKGGMNTIHQLARILAYPDMKVLIVGVMLLLVFSRLYGMENYWQSLMGDDYIRAVKNTAEEGIELLCYFLITVSAVLTQFGLKRLNQLNKEKC
ncbi:hypothetical protein [Vibrio salinus]|uniref:hypothetical protein n=1 Tax=Vibrio salinus TaxID=2899784 RepID=UPI001E5927CC|nr:hypothetical protein [Vibrio salinus]MCE0495624.1 hypothetical protein [Vibrio salinus]